MYAYDDLHSNACIRNISGNRLKIKIHAEANEDRIDGEFKDPRWPPLTLKPTPWNEASVAEGALQIYALCVCVNALNYSRTFNESKL